MKINYFVATLGDALVHDLPRPYSDVNHLIDKQADEHPDLPAVGFYEPSKEIKENWDWRILTFNDVRRVSVAAAEVIRKSANVSGRCPAGLVSASSFDFFITFFALIRLGIPVLLVAPQCSPTAIAHLCKACDVQTLFHDEGHKKLVTRAVKTAKGQDHNDVRIRPILESSNGRVLDMQQQTPLMSVLSSRDCSQDIAYYFHTSGTSSGVPNPIPTSHRGAVGVVPSLPGFETACFTTTPLYHGGVTDLLRAWTSSALIWLFPGQSLPITAANVVKCFHTSEAAGKLTKLPAIRYFSSVPYVLQMMSQDLLGLKLLQSMDLVGVGGAALPDEVGDGLVEKKVNLVSRYGSAECGFLMSSHRRYKNDKYWQYLRCNPGLAELDFEKVDDILSELIVRPRWPHMAKTNVEDGSYATADLFQRHPSIPNAWRYHSRADAQLTLITGKKFDPSPLESNLVALTPLLSGALIFGNGKAYPGALLFRAEHARDSSDRDVIEHAARSMAKLNAQSPQHAQISSKMLIPMQYVEEPLEKSSKGTIMRNLAETRFEREIEMAYIQPDAIHGMKVADSEVESSIRSIIEDAVRPDSAGPGHLVSDTDLFAYGVDSVAAIQIRSALTQLLPEDANNLPLSVVQDSGSVARLAKFILDRRHGRAIGVSESPRQFIAPLITQYSQFIDRSSTALPSSTAVNGIRKDLHVLLTGSTGFLGAHVLYQLLLHPQVATVRLLIRGATAHAARERVMKALTTRQLAIPANFGQKVTIIPCKLGDLNFGLQDSSYNTLKQEVNLIMHLAWSVNFLLPLRSFTSHFAALQSLINLSLRSVETNPPRLIFCSSIASVSSYRSLTGHIPEAVVEDLDAAGATGYAQSKLVAEHMCARAVADRPDLRGRISIVRVGQLSGDTKNGVWNSSEAYPLMLGSAGATGVLPQLAGERLNWLPVEIAAAGFIEAGIGNNTVVHSNEANPGHGTKLDDAATAVEVLHLLNPSGQTTWTDLLQTICQNRGSATSAESSASPHSSVMPPPFKIVDPETWLAKLNDLQRQSAASAEEKPNEGHTKKTQYHHHHYDAHPALRLLSFWRETYGPKTQSQSNLSRETQPDSDDRNTTRAGPGTTSSKDVPDPDQHQVGAEGWTEGGRIAGYDMRNSLRRMPSIKAHVGPLSEEYLLKLWDWVVENV